MTQKILTTQERRERAEDRLEQAMTNLLEMAEDYANARQRSDTTTDALAYRRRLVLQAGRRYGRSLDALTRVRKGTR